MKRFLQSLVFVFATIAFAAIPAHADNTVNTCPDGQILRNYVSYTGTGVQNGTPTPDHPVEPVFYQQGNMVLRAVGGVADSYDATTGKITRNVGVKVLDGTKNWQLNNSRFRSQGLIPISNNASLICSHFAYTGNLTSDNTIYRAVDSSWTQIRYGAADQNVETFKSWLAQQYTNGTPVTVYYPLAEPVEEIPESTTYCVSAIKIATKDYNNERFQGVRTALNNAVDTINGLVATTLNQAETIGTLATTRQNRPATGCPAGKQCLLVKNPSGADQWFEIFDPLYNFVTPLAQGTAGTCSATRYYGDVELRKLTNNTEDVRVWQYTNNEISADSRLRLLNQREWAAQWTDENDNSGIVYGESKCISTAAGTFPERLSHATTTAQQNALAMEYNEDFYASSQTWNTYSRCWCRATSVATQYGVYPINNSQWIAEYGHANGANCANLCAINCADDFKTNADFRQALFK